MVKCLFHKLCNAWLGLDGTKITPGNNITSNRKMYAKDIWSHSFASHGADRPDDYEEDAKVKFFILRCPCTYYEAVMEFIAYFKNAFHTVHEAHSPWR